MTESPRRPPMSDLSRSGYNSYASPDHRLSRRLGASLPNLDQPANESVTLSVVNFNRPQSVKKMTPDIGQYQWKEMGIDHFVCYLICWHICLIPGLKSPQKTVKVFRLPEFPPPLAYQYVQNYYSDMISTLGKAINTTPPDESALLARYFAGEAEKSLIVSSFADVCHIRKVRLF